MLARVQYLHSAWFLDGRTLILVINVFDPCFLFKFFYYSSMYLYLRIINAVLHISCIGEMVGSGDSFPEDVCPEDMYLCSVSRRCILMTQLCNAVDDCGNQEDESASMCGT